MDLTAIVVPTHVCNLRCKYCYNADERRPVMNRRILETVIRRLIQYSASVKQFAGTTFIWHGGEASIAGLDFYKDALSFQRQYATGARVSNFIQTNGLLLDDEWLIFLRENEFGLSMSIDGPKEVHDRNRVDPRGQGTLDRTLKVLERARALGLTPGVVVTVNKTNLLHMREIYLSLASLGIAFNVVPIVKSGDAVDGFDDFAITPEQWGFALIELFDLWYEGKPYIQIDDLVHATRAVMTGAPATCNHTRNCASFNISVDPKGDVYPCGWLSGHADLRYGNLESSSLGELLEVEIALALRNRDVPADCEACEWQHICHGGCRAHSYLYGKGTDGKTFYCQSIKMLYERIKNRLQRSQLPVGTPHDADPLDVLRSINRPENVTSRDAARKVIPLHLM